MVKRNYGTDATLRSFQPVSQRDAIQNKVSAKISQTSGSQVGNSNLNVESVDKSGAKEKMFQ